MFKKSVFLGLTSGIFAGIACVVYAHFYNDAMGSDFSRVVKPAGMIGACVFVGLLASVGCALFSK